MDDRVKGELKKAEGKVKEEFGKVVGDRSTEWGGKVDQVKGELQKKAGEIEMERQREEGLDKPASRWCAWTSRVDCHLIRRSWQPRGGRIEAECGGLLNR